MLLRAYVDLLLTSSLYPPLQGAITDPERLHVGLYERKDAHRIASETSSRLLLVYNLLSMSSLLARVFFSSSSSWNFHVSMYSYIFI